MSKKTKNISTPQKISYETGKAKIASIHEPVQSLDALEIQYRLDEKSSLPVHANYSNLSNAIVKGSCEEVLKALPDDSVDLIFTSPP